MNFCYINLDILISLRKLNNKNMLKQRQIILYKKFMSLNTHIIYLDCYSPFLLKMNFKYNKLVIYY